MDIVAKYIARALRFLMWFVVVWCGVRLLRWLFSQGADVGRSTRFPKSESSQADEHAIAEQKLVRDPVCGTHVAQRLALPLRDGGEVVHFCSPACRDRYVSATQKFAANS